jgi:hypothetical protein
MLQDLIKTLNAVGKSPELYQTDDGTRLLILPYGGRILGVFAPGSEENFLWTNSVLNSVESARAYYASDDWQNSGSTSFSPSSLTSILQDIGNRAAWTPATTS